VKRLLVVAIGVLSLWAAPGAFAATWCGTGESPIDRPDVVTGRQIHAIYAVASDGGDTFPTVSTTIATDVASITSWWQGQDPTRIPNFDQAVFPAGTCVDVSVVRLPTTQAALSAAGAANAYELVGDELEAAGFQNPYKKYLVYYDGQSVQDGVCGTGGGEFATGPAFAIVWLQGCPGVPTDSIAAHELLHALGALPAGAPHACPGDSGHPCDSSLDVLYPYNSGLPLSQLYLDWNHDDYYAHSGSWIDIQDSLWLHRLDEAPVSLTLAFTGAGEVVSDLPGLDCTANCTTQWDPGSQVTLMPKAGATSHFVRWGGACIGIADCSLTLQAAQTATALFGPKTIPVRVKTVGKGRVSCTPACSGRFNAGRALRLKALPLTGWRFTGWSGACKGTSSTCRPVTDFALAVTATFKKKPAVTKKKKR
jgi:hypothetical protein